MRRSGRLGAARWLLGTILHIKPLIGVYHGVVQPPLAMPRTRSQGLARLAEMAAELAPLESLAVVHARAPDLAAALLVRVAGLFPRDEIIVAETGVIIGTYAGPGAVGFMCVQAPRGGTASGDKSAN